MVKPGAKKIQLMAATGLFAMALAVLPAKASHDHDVVLPMVAGFALGAIAFRGHHRHHHYYRYERHGYRKHGHSRYRYSKRGHGHYAHQPRHSSSHGGYHRQPRHDHSRGGYHQPRRKH